MSKAEQFMADLDRELKDKPTQQQIESIMTRKCQIRWELGELERRQELLSRQRQALSGGMRG